LSEREERMDLERVWVWVWVDVEGIGVLLRKGRRKVGIEELLFRGREECARGRRGIRGGMVGKSLVVEERDRHEALEKY
jgi:hypothetical protein